MKVVHINKSDLTGGAAVAASRIVAALRQRNVDASMLVAEKKSKHAWVTSIIRSRKDNARLMFYFLQDIVAFLPYEKNKRGRFAFSLSRKGFDLSNHPLIRDADIIHLHWFNQGFLSLKGLQTLINTGKPIVWTLHDMWSFTGGCHYTAQCDHYTNSCGNCPMLLESSAKDLSFVQYAKKQNIYSDASISFATCSNWLKQMAQKATLIKQFPIHCIHNPIDTDQFKPKPRIEARRELGLPLDKKIILFGAANTSDPRKGMPLLLHALNELKDKPYNQHIELVIFGKTTPGIEEKLPFRTTLMHYINKPELLVNLYNAADLFVLPSLEDNLPNTVMESLSCGTPVAAFRIGGVPEMVAHGTCGYLAPAGDAKGLAEGIDFLLSGTNQDYFRQEARQRVIENFSPDLVAGQYIELYESLLP